MSRREPIIFLLLTLFLALAGLGLYCIAGGPAKEAAPMPDTVIVTATDLHFISPALTDHGEYFERMISRSDGKVMDYSDELTDAFLEEVIRRRPAALILSGDLTFNGARQSHLDLAEKLRTVTDAGIPVLVIPGNHDLESTDAARFHGDSFTRVDSVTPAEFAEIYAGCGYDGALARDPASLSYVYALSPALRVLLIDVNMPDAVNLVKEETLAWAEAQLGDAAAAGAKVIAASHQNLLQHNSLIVENYRIRNGDALLSLYEKYGVIANLTGHLHCQHIARSEGGFYDIATSALSVSPCQYGILTLGPETGRYDTAPVDVSAWAKAHGLNDPNLLDFAAWARDFFRNSGRDQSPEDYADLPDGAELAAFVADVNAAYFSGRMDTVDMDDPRFDRLLALGGFMGSYLASTRDDGPADMTHLILY